MPKYYIYIGKEKVEVAKPVYRCIKQSKRQLRYLTYDLKTEKIIITEDKVTVIPSREDSYDRRVELGHEFSDSSESIEDVVIRKLMTEKLRYCLDQLNETDRWLINELFFNHKSERQLAIESGIPRMTLCNRKNQILERLKKLMEK